MTISNTTYKVRVEGNDSATSFSFSPMVVQGAGQLEVTLLSDGVETELVEGTGTSNYSVSVSSFPGTGSITYPASGSGTLAAGEFLIIRRETDFLQSTDLENQGGYFPDTQEDQYDKLAIEDLKQQEELDRSIKMPVSDDSPTVELPIAADRANRNLTFDGSGNAQVSVGLSSDVVVSAFIETVLDDANASDALDTLGAGAKGKAILADATSSDVLDELGAGATGKALLADATSADARTELDVFSKSEVQDSGDKWGGTSGGTANAQTITVTPTLTAYVAGQKFRFDVGTTNTGAVTLDVDSVGAKNIKTRGGAALESDELVAGEIVEVIYDGTEFRIQKQIERQTIFTANDTYTTPTGLIEVEVEVQSAGGGGGGTETTAAGENAEAGCGGAGGYGRKRIKVGTLGSTETVTVGTGGTGGSAGDNPGSTGGTSSFGSHVSVTGGSGGAGGTATSGNNNENGGVGGVSSSGDININGQIGPRGSVIGGRFSGLPSGADSRFGAGGAWNRAAAPTGFGSSAGAQASGPSAGNETGGDGQGGIVIVKEVF